MVRGIGYKLIYSCIIYKNINVLILFMYARINVQQDLFGASNFGLARGPQIIWLRNCQPNPVVVKRGGGEGNISPIRYKIYFSIIFLRIKYFEVFPCVHKWLKILSTQFVSTKTLVIIFSISKTLKIKFNKYNDGKM